MAFQDWEGVSIVIPPPVVERNETRVIWKTSIALKRLDKLSRGYYGVIVLQKNKLLFK